MDSASKLTCAEVTGCGSVATEASSAFAITSTVSGAKAASEKSFIALPHHPASYARNRLSCPANKTSGQRFPFPRRKAHFSWNPIVRYNRRSSWDLNLVMKRREFLGLLGSTALARPFQAAAQQSGLPVIGFLSSRSKTDSPRMLDGFRKGLAEAGFTDGQNITIDYRFAEGHYDRLAPLAAELGNSPIAVLVA